MLLRGLNKRKNAVKRAVLHLAGGANHGLAVEIKGAAADRIADALWNRQRFAGQRGFIGRCRALDDHAIDWKQFAGFDEELVVRLNFFNRDFDPRFTLPAQRSLRRGLQQRFDRFLCAMIGELFERVAERKKKKQRCPFGPGVNRCRAQRNKDHQKLDVDPSLLESPPDILCGKPAPRDVCDREERQDPQRGKAGPLQNETSERAHSACAREREHDSIVSRRGRRDRPVSPTGERNALPNQARFVGRMRPMEFRDVIVDVMFVEKWGVISCVQRNVPLAIEFTADNALNPFQAFRRRRTVKAHADFSGMGVEPELFDLRFFCEKPRHSRINGR